MCRVKDSPLLFGRFCTRFVRKRIETKWVQKIFEGAFNNSVELHLTSNSFSKIVSAAENLLDILCFDELCQMILSLAETIVTRGSSLSQTEFLFKLSYLDCSAYGSCFLKWNEIQMTLNKKKAISQLFSESFNPSP